MNDMDHEREKYRRMWAEPAYRQHSPGLEAVPDFLERCKNMILDKPTLLDVGCGTGRAGMALHQAGFYVTLTDLVNAVDFENIELPFISSAIHEFNTDIYYDWIYCVDVLEHIPPFYLTDTLDNLSKLATHGYLKIACFPDGCGTLIGETLHMIVRPPQWWRMELEHYWNIDDDFSNSQYANFVVSQ